MLLDLNIPHDRNKAETYFAKLISDGAKIELRQIRPPRTLRQNKYVHALFALWGAEWGWSIDEAKIVVKRELGYIYERNGQDFPVKTSGMDTGQLTEFINKFRNWSAHNGLHLPSADEFHENYFEIMKEVERAEIMQKRYG